MYTATSKSILSPLAEAVTALILIISESEINKSPMPDLSALAKIVDDQIHNLVQVGKRIASQSTADEKLKSGMPEACDDVLKSSSLLLNSTSQLVRDPYSSPGRMHLLEAVKGILRGTTSVLTTFDDAEIRRILNASKIVRMQVQRIEQYGVAVDGLGGGALTASMMNLVHNERWDGNEGHQPGATSLTPTELDRLKLLQAQKQKSSLHTHSIHLAIAGQTVVTLAQLTHKRISEVLSPLLQSRLKAAVEGLVRESPLMMSAARVAARNPGVMEAKGIRTAACARVVNICREIEIVVQLTGDEPALTTQDLYNDFLKHRKKVDEAASSIRSAVASGSDANLKQALSDYHHATVSVVADAKRTIDILKTPSLKNDLQILTEVLTTAEPKIAAAAQAALEKPDSLRHQQELLSLIDLAAEKHNALVTAKTRALVGDLTTTLSSLSDRRLTGTPYNSFLDAAGSGNKPKLTSAFHDLESEAIRMLNLTTLAQEAGVGSGGEVARDMGEVKDRLVGMIPSLSAAGLMTVMSPEDKASHEHLETVCETWENSLREILNGPLCQDGAFKVNDLLTGAKTSLDKHAELLDAAAISSDVDRARREGNDVVACASQLLAITKRELEISEDAGYRSNLEMKIREAERIIPQLIGRTKAIVEAHKITPADAAYLQSNVKELTSKFFAIGELIRSHRGIVADHLQEHPTEMPASPELSIQGISVQLLENVLSDVVFVDEEPPMPLAEAEAKANPIQAAAQELKIEASHWTSKDNPIILAAQKMSERLSDLATHHQHLRKEASAESKRAFITAAQQIMSEASAIVLASRPIADLCTDKRLKSTLLLDLDRIDTLAQQLKIIAAVKTSAPGDTDRDLQLIGCAQNLMLAVKSCLNHAESGSLRVAKGALVAVVSGEKTAVAAKPASQLHPSIRFRRNVYRSKRMGPAR
ncbi:hypothetical protein HDU97_007360 [Phlyctochytrium planicorne]|nr:hypothetical protein HDU97_007360 [Phlyctochytrium planicorne]